LEDIVLQTEEDIENVIGDKHDKRGIPVDASKLILSSNTFDEKSYTVLTSIQSIVSNILAVISGNNHPPYGGVPMSPTSNIPPTPPTPSSGNGISGKPSISQQKTVTINKPDVVI